MSDVIDRRVMLGGETRPRGIVAGGRSKLEWAGMLATGAPALVVMFTGPLTWQRMALVALIIIVAVGLWTPFVWVFRGRSIAALVAEEVRFQVRRRQGLFVPAHHGETVEGKEPSAFVTPAPVGNAGAKSVTLPSGDELAVVHHTNQVPGHGYTVAFEMVGSTSGLETEWGFGAAHEAWGSFCARLARQGSHIRTVQEVMRVVPYDTADHTKWIGDRIPAAADPRLGQSYVELLDYIGGHTEQHRSWLVLRIPATTMFSADALRLGPGEEGRLRLLTEEVVDAMDRARDHGLALRPLDRRRLGAVLRSLQDAEHPIDQIAGRSFENSWLPWDSHSRRFVTVKAPSGDWLARTVRVPKYGIEAGMFAPDFLHPLLSDVSPSVVRTISTVINLTPAAQARGKARSDVTLDTGTAAAARGRVSDGSEDDQLTISQRRLRDLKAGSGHHGAGWGMTITMFARTQEELDAACRRIEAAAEKAKITELEYVDGQQEGGLVASLPLARGLKG